jgi:hypothetical protein
VPTNPEENRQVLIEFDLGPLSGKVSVRRPWRNSGGSEP